MLRKERVLTMETRHDGEDLIVAEVQYLHELPGAGAVQARVHQALGALPVFGGHLALRLAQPGRGEKLKDIPHKRGQKKNIAINTRNRKKIQSR